MANFRFSLSKKALAAIAVILLPVIITFSFGYYNNRELLKGHVLDNLTVVSEAYEGQVYQFIEMSRRRAEDFSTDGFIAEGLLAAARGRDVSASLGAHLRNKKLPLDRHIHTIHLLDLKGRVVASTEESHIGRDLSGEDFFKERLSGVTAMESVDEKGRPHLVLSAPVLNAAKEPIGVLSNSMLLSELSDLLSGDFHRELGAISWNKGKKETMEAYIVNSSGKIIAGSNLKENGRPIKVETEPVNACKGALREISGFYDNYSRVNVAGASMCIPSLNWTLLVEYETDEALAAVTAMRRQAVVTGLIVVGLISLLYLFFRSVVSQLRRLSSAADAISAGDYDITLPIETRDEIGMLAGNFNAMAHEIKRRNLDLEEGKKRLKDILDNSAAVVYMKDPGGGYIFVNHKFESLFNVKAEELRGRTDYDLFPREMADAFRANDRKVLERRAPMEFEEEALHNGTVHTYISIKFPLFDSAGDVYAVCGFSTDITERKRAAEILKETEERLTMAQRIGRIGSWDWRIPENRLWWSEETYDIFGLKTHEFGATYEAFLASVHPEDRDLVKRSVKEALFGGKPYSIDHRIVLPDGGMRTVHEQANVYFDGAGNPARMVGTIQDITEQKKTEFELKKLSMAIEQSVNIVFITNTDGVIEYVNPMFEKVTGYTGKDAIGQTPRILASGEVTDKEYEELWRTILSGKTWHGNYKNRKKTGGYYWCNTVISPIKDELGRITHFLAVQEDVTQKRFSEERIKYLAHHDELTGLINRSRFIELLDQWIGYAQTCNAQGALLLMDMDGFQYINDTYGLGAGDEFLLRLSKLFQDTLNRVKRDFGARNGMDPVLSRLSGDEFAVLLPSFSESEGLQAAEEFRRDAEKFQSKRPPISSTASIGVVVYPKHGLTTRELLTRADASMHRAKELGRNRAHLFRPEDRDLEKIHSRLRWKEKILKALREDRFEPWYQPILSLTDNRIHHFEALARMRDEDGTILLPGAFIDIAERFSLVGLIDRAITEKTIRMQAEMRRAGKRLSFSMNLSGKDLGDDGLLSFLQDKIKDTGADPDCLIFEITETAAIGDLDRAIRFIKSLNSLGCHFSLDDFGVGFTSFTYLREMQVDYIKIDGSFIKKLPESPNDQVFVKAMTDVARGLHVQTIAEFVETEETFRILKKLGVDYAQGYLIGKPAPGLVEEDAFLVSYGAAHTS
ncbi:MAG: EAL domain-containing protein [Deltaproteobacteria bacterium]|nr:EAL domain-containing protein [Deltaproteobacteria bacterium]